MKAFSVSARKTTGGAWWQRPEARCAFLFTGAWLLAVAVPAGAVAVCVGSALYALRGPRQVIQAFTILVLLLLVGVDGISAARWLVVLAGAIRGVLDIARGERVPVLFWLVSIYVLYLLITASTSSWLPVISYFKAISFYLGVSALIGAFARTRHLQVYWRRWFTVFSLFVVWASGVVLLLGMGYGRNGVGFQGILSHPQTFGPVAAILGAFLLGQLLDARVRAGRWLRLSVVVALGGVYLSQARTALLAFVLAFGLTMTAALLISRWRSGIRLLLSGASLGVLVFAGLFVFVAYGDAVEANLRSFLQKTNEELYTGADTDVVGAFQASRGELIEASMANWRASPWLGIGFGVPSDLSDVRVQTGWMGLPTGASTEKGFMPSAVLEETGLFGALLLLGLIGHVFYRVLADGSFSACLVVSTCVLVNFGEMIFFAFGGNGSFVWIFMIMMYMESNSEASRASIPRWGRKW